MLIAVSAKGSQLDDPISPMFGRCPNLVFVDTETMAIEAAENASAGASGGAGIQSAQFIVERGAEAVITGNVGPNAMEVLSAAGIAVYQIKSGTIREAVAQVLSKKAVAVADATVGSHAGPSVAVAQKTREEEIASLAREAAELRKRLAAIMVRISELEREQ